jgi:hypothetical protein
MALSVKDDDVCSTTRAQTIERLKEALNRRVGHFMSTSLAWRDFGFREVVICLGCASIRRGS